MTTEKGVNVIVMDDAECVQLLASHRFGRIAFDHESWPLILPVNYLFDEPNVLMRTAPGAKLECVPLRPVCFEIDDADLLGCWGWSVVVQGPAFDITDSHDKYSVRLRSRVIDTWAPGERAHWLKVTAERVSGRRFGPAPDGEL